MSIVPEQNNSLNDETLISVQQLPEKRVLIVLLLEQRRAELRKEMHARNEGMLRVEMK